MIVLAVYHAAFVCEALRSGVNTMPARSGRGGPVDRADLRAEPARGDPPAGVPRRRSRPLGSTLIALIKNTTVAAVIGVAEAAGLMTTIIENETRHARSFGIFAIGFVILTLPLGILFTSLSQRLAVKR